ncbi:hypothetical protein LJC61_04440 [Ruminococcaceae bacterium OttesenSCG-928-A16]|nr:hypothetical protein [Ruminococcaceae bacterium OttesenSCG-928-A16]
MSTFTTDQRLINQGILFPDGTPNKNKLNLLSGAFVTPFADMLSACTSSTQHLGYTLDLMRTLSSDTQQCFKLLSILYDLMGMDMPNTIVDISQNQNAFEFFMHEYIADFAAITQEDKQSTFL